MELKEMIAQDSEFNINGKKYVLRPMNLSDKIWLAKEYGESVEALFSKGDMGICTRMAYRLLRDKSCYAPRNITEIDESGMTINRSSGGLEVFASELIGNKAVLAMVEALGSAMMAGEPAVESGTVTPVSSNNTEAKESPLAQ
jgi:hypothetical protein